MASESTTNYQDAGVYELITEICAKTASKYSAHNRISHKRLTSKMRSHAYELILRKNTKDLPNSMGDPIAELLSYYFVYQQNVKSTAEYKRAQELKELLSTIRQANFGNNKENVYNVLRFLVGASNSVKEDLSAEMFQRPFTFGLLNEMLPRPPIETFGSPEPYPYFPSHVFELPYSFKNQGALLDQKKSQAFTEYTVESYDSKSLLLDLASTQSPGQLEVRTFLSPMSLSSMTSSHVSPYSEKIFNYPRLTAPRDLVIPGSESNYTNAKISSASNEIKPEVKEMSLTESKSDFLDIWELVTHIDKDIPDDIWEVVAKLPPINERQLIATSSREIRLWRNQYEGQLSDLKVISEKQLIRHIMYLCIGVETPSFPYSHESNCFYMKENLILEGISKEHLKGYVTNLLLIGTYYRRLYKFAFNQTLEDHFHSHGLVYEASREVIRTYLLQFRLKATEIYEECCKTEELNCMPTLLQILFHMEPLKYEIETLCSIYKMIDTDSKNCLPYGAELMSYFFKEISMVTHKQSALTTYNSLFSICQVYFKFIEKFIFEGELDDRYNEFFIRKDCQYVNCRSKRYWDKGYHISQSVAVPEFLRPLAKYILLCGKSLRLLKLCNPCDPLVLLISSDHPSVKCCASFDDLERQQQLLDVYRTRCLFVTGELVTFDQILLKREAERKAFTEMATIKQAETLEKIVAERKRLAQLIIVEKQHSLRVLEAAMAEAKAAKLKAKQRERQRYQLEAAGDKAEEEVDSRLRDDERNKLMEYYSKLNIEVERKQMHTEWKIKRLQLDQSRMQLLSTEERNLKREKLELEYQKSEDIGLTSNNLNNDDKRQTTDNTETFIIEPKTSMSIEIDNNTNSVHKEANATAFEDNKKKAQTSTDVFSAICNAAKSFFGVRSDDKCDNANKLDSQGNVIVTEVNSNETKTSNDVIGANVSEFDNEQFMNVKREAYLNKQKVLAHEFCQDSDNNPIGTPFINVVSVDEENNVQNWTPFVEAKRNKLKVLGDEFGLKPKPIHIVEPITEAQKEAVANKKKVLGDEFGLKPELTIKSEPVTDAQKEAVTNKKRILGDDFGLEPEQIHIFDPITDAQKEAATNKKRILGDDFGLKPEQIATFEPITEAQKEALINKQRVLGVEYNLPAESYVRREPLNIAQEEAIKNKHKVLTSEHEGRSVIDSPKKEPNKRSGLTLNLKPYGETYSGVTATPVTPGDLFPGLDLETPTTADIPLEGAITSDIFTPRDYKDIESARSNNDKEFLSSEGFNFPILDDSADSEVASDGPIEASAENSPTKSLDNIVSKSTKKHSVFNILDGSYSLEEFDPFGVKELKTFSQDHFSNKMDLEMSSSCYTHPAIIMQEVKKRPYSNIYKSHFESDADEQQKITSDNIATLTACLQRSVMLPLTYQLEVVNNSILTYFLVDLDMYEHLRSLKDYFFLMDGEFSRSICHNLFSKLTKTLNPQELLNFATLHNILDKALGSSISHVHKFSENLSFTISDTPLSFIHSSPDVLQCLSLTYTVSWPLNIILSQEALLRYAKVFQFLVKMRRIFWVLGEDFQNLKLVAKLSKNHSRKLLRSPQYVSIQIHRHIMASMIRAIDNYIVTTCILSSWTEFENELKKARTLDDLYECHVTYIKNVLFRCLLNNRSTPVMKLLNDMFTVILKFSRVLKAGEWQQKEENGSFTHTNFAQLQDLFHLFEKLAKYLHKVVTKLMECGYQRHLVELLTMINLNGYYDPDKTKEEQVSGLQ